jgi:PAS domain S-box-containing protein
METRKIKKNGSTTAQLNGTQNFFEAGFYSLLNNIEEGCFLLDTHFNILHMNKFANDISLNTYEISYAVGENLLSLAPSLRKPRLSRALNEALSGKTINFVVRFEKKSGRVISTECKYSPVYNNGKQVVGICVLLKDTTARNELETSEARLIQVEEKLKESLQLFEQFMENSPLRAWITDGDGFIQYMNPLHREFLALGDDYLGKSLYDIFPKALADEYIADDKKTLEHNQHLELLQVGMKQNGKKGIYKVYKFPIIIKDKIMVAGWAVELTKQVFLQKQLLNQQNKNKRAIIRSIIATQEKERRQFSVELHDNVNQIISSCKLMLEVALENESKRLELIQKSYVSLKEVIEEIRTISHNLNPSALDDIGLVEAVAELVDRMNAAGKLSVEFDHLRFRLQHLSSEKRITIYRILQESLNNTLKHANATNVWITLYSNEAHVLLTIRDNGVGFNVQKTKKGLGLRNILHRVEYNRGKIKLDSAPGKGCTIKVLLPIPQN